MLLVAPTRTDRPHLGLALHRPMPHVPLLEALASLKDERPPAIVTEEENVAFGCAVLRVLMSPTHDIAIQLKSIQCSRSRAAASPGLC